MASKVTNVAAVATLYLSYFIYALGLIAAGQFGDNLATQWGVETKDVTAAIAWMAVGKIVTYTVAGIFADKVGRKPSVVIGLAMCASFFVILPISPNPTVGMIAALVFGAGNSFLDSGTYPTLMESNPSNAGTMNIIIKLFISAGQFVLPMVVIRLGDNWKWLLYFAGAYMVAMLVFTILVKFPNYKEIGRQQAAALEKKDDSESTVKANFAIDGIVCLLFIFCTNGVVYLVNQAMPQIGSAIAGLTGPQGKTLTQFIALGSVIAVILTAILASKGIKSIHFVPVYAVGGVVAVLLLNMPFMASFSGMKVSAFLIGYFVSGGIMQLVLTALSEFFPKAKGTIVAWYWMIGSLGGFVLPYLVKVIVPSVKEVEGKLVDAITTVDPAVGAELADKFSADKANALASSSPDIAALVDERNSLLASGYTNVAWVAVAFAVVALLTAFVVYARHRKIFASVKSA